MHATGAIDDALPDVAIKRLISMYIVQSLEKDALEVASEYLIDTFIWCKSDQDILEAKSDRMIIGKGGLRISKAKPVEFQD